MASNSVIRRTAIQEPLAAAERIIELEKKLKESNVELKSALMDKKRLLAMLPLFEEAW